MQETLMSKAKKTTPIVSAEIGDIRKTGESCFCGSPFPWHIHMIFDERMSHTCDKGHVWKWVSDGFSYAGLGSNPIAEYDRAAASKRN